MLFRHWHYPRWYADDEDDGAITREHFADNDGALLMSECFLLVILSPGTLTDPIHTI